jgi:hypothetical protein
MDDGGAGEVPAASLDKRQLLRQMEFESVKLRAELLERERLVKAMRKQVSEEDTSSSAGPPPLSSGGSDMDLLSAIAAARYAAEAAAGPVDKLTKSLERSQLKPASDSLAAVPSSLAGLSGGAPPDAELGGGSGASGGAGGQSLMSSLLRKASTLSRPGGAVSINFKDLLKDLILMDHPGVKEAIDNSDADDGAELRALLQAVALQKLQQEDSRLREQLALRERLLQQAVQSQDELAAASDRAHRQLVKEPVNHKKLQRLGLTAGGAPGQVLNGLFQAGYHQPPPMPMPQQQQQALLLQPQQHNQLQLQLQQRQLLQLQQLTAQQQLTAMMAAQAPPPPAASYPNTNAGAGANSLSLAALQQVIMQQQLKFMSGGASASPFAYFPGLRGPGFDAASFGLPPPMVPMGPPADRAPPGISPHFANNSSGQSLGNKRDRPESMNQFVKFRENTRPQLSQLEVGESSAQEGGACRPTSFSVPPSADTVVAAAAAAAASSSAGLANPFTGAGSLELKLKLLRSQFPSLALSSAESGAAASLLGLEGLGSLGGPSMAPAVLPVNLAHLQQQQLQQQLQQQPLQQQQLQQARDGRPDIGPSSAPRRWTDEEDELLRDAVARHNEKNWKAIADQVPGRNHVQCLQRWRKALDPNVVKGHWTAEEDAKLLVLVAENPKNWGHVAKGIPGRTAKQCRERYHNHLDPNIKKGDWTPEEDAIIVEQQWQLGNKWALIASSLSGRTENSVKIRWKSIQRYSKISAGGFMRPLVKDEDEDEDDEAES